MLDYRLSDSELAALRLAHRTMRDQRKADRLKAVYLLGKGWSAVQVSEALLVDDDTVRNWFKRYREQGQEGLVKWSVGGSQGYLLAEQQALLRLHLEDSRIPLYGLTTTREWHALYKSGSPPTKCSREPPYCHQ